MTMMLMTASAMPTIRNNNGIDNNFTGCDNEQRTIVEAQSAERRIASLEKIEKINAIKTITNNTRTQFNGTSKPTQRDRIKQNFALLNWYNNKVRWQQWCGAVRRLFSII